MRKEESSLVQQGFSAVNSPLCECRYTVCKLLGSGVRLDPDQTFQLYILTRVVKRYLPRGFSSFLTIKIFADLNLARISVPRYTHLVYSAW